MHQYIVIEGNIGAGKTTLASKIAEQHSARLILEQFEDNSFLPKFYNDPERFAFPLELSFLADRFQQLKTRLLVSDLFSPFTIADYFIHKSLIFAGKTLNPDEFLLYTKLFGIIDSIIPKPNLLVYLHVEIDHLQSNIKKRGRSYEQKIPDDYLEKIQNGYLDYLKQQQDFPVLILDTNKLDFVKNVSDYEKICDLIFRPWELGVHRIML